MVRLIPRRAGLIGSNMAAISVWIGAALKVHDAANMRSQKAAALAEHEAELKAAKAALVTKASHEKATGVSSLAVSQILRDLSDAGESRAVREEVQSALKMSSHQEAAALRLMKGLPAARETLRCLRDPSLLAARQWDNDVLSSITQPMTVLMTAQVTISGANQVYCSRMLGPSMPYAHFFVALLRISTHAYFVLAACQVISALRVEEDRQVAEAKRRKTAYDQTRSKAHVALCEACKRTALAAEAARASNGDADALLAHWMGKSATTGTAAAPAAPPAPPLSTLQPPPFVPCEQFAGTIPMIFNQQDDGRSVSYVFKMGEQGLGCALLTMTQTHPFSIPAEI